jgi:acyl-CoA thioesterase-1
MRASKRETGAGRKPSRSPQMGGYEGAPRGFNAARRLAAVVAILAACVFASVADAAEKPRILALGDSLTAGYGLPAGHDLATRLEAKLNAEQVPVTIINAGVSGDTTAGGLARLDWVLADKPDAVILELGANDALRGIDPDVTRDNLDKILARLKQDGIKVLLMGMLAPTNWGAEYKQRFDAIYPELAKKYDVPFDPFILDGVAMKPELNQPDMLHPNDQGVDVVVARMAPYVKRLLGKG